jgi:transcriptional regulator with XRE-family HTH domain
VDDNEYTEYEQALVRALGRRIAAERVAAGLTQEELAKRVGVVRKTMVRYENGERDAPFITLIGIARALGLESVTDLTLAAEAAAKREVSSASRNPRDSGDDPGEV